MQLISNISPENKEGDATITTTKNGKVDHPTRNDDYSLLLVENGLSFKQISSYLQVGDIAGIQGWILHISVVISQVPSVLELLIPFLALQKVAFKIPQNKDAANLLLDGMLGFNRVGKVISVYPDTQHLALSLAQELISLTQSFKGPDIPTDAYLGGRVYTRYGSFNPVMKQESNGAISRYINNAKGELVPDLEVIPFALTAGLSWPFGTICPPPSPKPKAILQERVKLTEVIKADVKGGVFKGVYKKNWFQVQTCIIKEGRQHMYSDDHGRDIQDRLEWQLKLHDTLCDLISIPKILDSFRDTGDAYLVMEYVDGIPLEHAILDICAGNSWLHLAAAQQLQLLDYLLQVITMVQVLHEKGYIHRDITTGNFLVDKQQKLHMIDLELVYSLDAQYPVPPFALGTTGFMSPEQRNINIPTVKEDIYGLGALMTTCFTGLSPTAFDTKSSELHINLNYFIGNHDISMLIGNCLQEHPSNRPALSDIRSTIQQLRDKPPAIAASQSIAAISTEMVSDTLESGLNGLLSKKLRDENGLWFSIAQQQAIVANVQTGRAYYMGLYEGVAGVLHTLFTIKQTGYNIQPVLKQSYKENLGYLQQYGFSQIHAIPGGLYSGSAGLAMLLASGMNCGFLQQADDNFTLIAAGLDRDPKGLDLANGAAGQGIALLYCSQYLPENLLKARLEQILTMLTNTQQKDGSWLFPTVGGNKKDIHISGLANGTSGIICFLLAVARQYQDALATQLAVKALSWLQKQAIKSKNTYLWHISDTQQETDPWLIHGVSGIAYTFIKAYELLHEPVYKTLAEGALNNHAAYVTYRDLSLASGIAGLGEVYLEAAKILGNKEWQSRADWIAGALIHQRKMQGDDACYWTFNNTHHTADLMTGNSGILYFLARYYMPDKMSFPLLP